MKIEQNRMVLTIQICVFLTEMDKWLTIFERVLTPFWKTRSVSTKTCHSLNGKFTAKIDLRVFYVTITDAVIGSLKYLHTLFVKYLDHMLVTFQQKSYGPNCTKF